VDSTLDTFALMVRVSACAGVAVYGGAKLARLPFAVDSMWLPKYLSSRTLALVLVASIAVLEVAFAFVLAMNLLPWHVGTAFNTILGVCLSAYGTISIRERGACGCGGSESRDNSVTTLWLRNAAIFGAIAASAIVGPSFGELSHGQSGEVASIAALPMVGLLAALMVRATLSGWPPASTKAGWVHSRIRDVVQGPP
jgi:hypothetical protein